MSIYRLHSWEYFMVHDVAKKRDIHISSSILYLFGRNSWIGAIFIVIIVPFFVSLLNISHEARNYLLCIIFLLACIWIAGTIKYISPNFFNLYSLFMLAALLFNGGQALLEVFGMNPMTLLGGRFHPEIISKTLYLVVFSIVCFHAGGIFSTREGKSIKENVENNDSLSINTSHEVRIIAYALFVISFIPAVLLLIEAIDIVMREGYFALYQQERATGLNAGFEGITLVLSQFFVPALLFLLAGNEERKVLLFVVVFLLLLYTSALFFVGHRRYATMIFLATLWIWHVMVHPLNLRKLFLLGGILLFVIFPTVKLIRNIEGGARLSWQYMVDAYISIESPIIMTISEMGGSMGTIAHTLNLIPYERPFALGTTYLYVASSIVPNLFWNVHPTIEYGSLGRWLTMTVDPLTFLSGGGLGYSFIAEAYANFGWVGTPFVMGLFGFAIAKLTNWPRDKNDYARIAVVAVCMANMLLWVRGDANMVFRPLIYYALVPYLAYHFLKSVLDKRR